MTELDNKNAGLTSAETVQELDEISHPSSVVPKGVPKLPPEILELILPKVPTPQKRTFYVCCLVSKLWHNIALRFLWSDITIARPWERSLPGVPDKLPLVRLLRDRCIAPQGFLRCISTGALASVRILSLMSVTETSLSTIFSHCPRLIAVDAELGPSYDRETLDGTRVLREGFSKLKSLNLRLYDAASAERLLQLVAESVRVDLESITLDKKFIGMVEYHHLLTLIGKRCSNLRDLGAHCTDGIRLMIPLLPAWSRLVRLQCQFCVSQELLEQIATLCVNLKYLELALMMQDLHEFAYWLQHRGGSLVVFNAPYCKYLTDALLEILAQYAPNLKVAGVGLVESSRGALAILRGCAKLETLSFERDETLSFERDGTLSFECDETLSFEFDYKCRTIYDTAASQGVSVTHRPLPLTPYAELMKEKWIGL
ncbi:hypothetical protein HK104_003176 [Borealophlyctis nickersoniae]|nr:hypothetical protein HK104_003176 [Borealophlyctis nickersoniae]